MSIFFKKIGGEGDDDFFGGWAIGQLKNVESNFCLFGKSLRKIEKNSNNMFGILKNVGYNWVVHQISCSCSVLKSRWMDGWWLAGWLP